MEIVYLFLGWSLGLLSPQIIEHINRHYKKHDFIIGLLSELSELKARLITNVYLLAKKISDYDKEQLEWLINNIGKYEGAYPLHKIKENITKLIEESNSAQLKAIGSNDEYASEKRGLSLKKFHLPFLEAKIDSLALLDEERRIQIFEIRSQLNILNEEIDNAQFYFRKTFDSLTDTKEAIVKLNLESCYKNIMDGAKRIVEMIGNSKFDS